MLLQHTTKPLPQTIQASDIGYSHKSVTILMLYSSRTVRNWLLQKSLYSKITFAIGIQVLEVLGFCSTKDETVTIIPLQAELMLCKDAKNHQL